MTTEELVFMNRTSLVLSRKVDAGKSLIIVGEGETRIEILVTHISKSSVNLRVTAPEDVLVDRGEVRELRL